MPDTEHEQRIITNTHTETTLFEWVEAFIHDRRAQNLREKTVVYYQLKLRSFVVYCEAQVITHVQQVTANTIRGYLLWLKDSHNDGGVHSFYRALKAFLIWFEKETEPDNWHNPIKKVRAPRVAIEPLEPVTPDTIQKLLSVCTQGDFTGARDYAMILFLFDTGCRASEICALDVAD